MRNLKNQGSHQVGLIDSTFGLKGAICRRFHCSLFTFSFINTIAFQWVKVAGNGADGFCDRLAAANKTLSLDSQRWTFGVNVSEFDKFACNASFFKLIAI